MSTGRRGEGAEGLDAEHDAGGVEPGTDDERQQLADVVEPGPPGGPAGRRAADIEQGLQQQDRDDQQPVPGNRLTDREHGSEDHDQRDGELLQLDQHVAERQAGPGEVKRPDQRQAVEHHPRGDDERALREVEDEDPDDQESDEIVHAPAGVQDEPEDQVVHGHVEQRRQDLPDLTQPGLGVHGHVARGGETGDEIAALPFQAFEVVPHRWPGRTRLEAVAFGQLRERLAGQLGRLAAARFPRPPPERRPARRARSGCPACSRRPARSPGRVALAGTSHAAEPRASGLHADGNLRRRRGPGRRARPVSCIGQLSRAECTILVVVRYN